MNKTNKVLLFIIAIKYERFNYQKRLNLTVARFQTENAFDYSCFYSDHTADVRLANMYLEDRQVVGLLADEFIRYV